MNSLTREALALHTRGRLAEAEAVYLAAVAADGRDFKARQLLGVVRAQMGRADEALVDLDAALMLAPDDAEALLNRANVLKMLGRNAAALAGFDAALAARPGWAQAHNNRATVLRKLGRDDAALAAYDAALASDPRHGEALLNRGSLMQDRKQWTRALADYDAALAAEPRRSAALNNRGSVLLAMGHGDAALATFDQGLAREPNDAGLHNNRGNALLALGRNAEALAAYDRALALRPGYADAHGNRGTVLQELKRHAEALESFDKAGTGTVVFGGAAMAALHLNDWARIAGFAAQMPLRIAAGEAVPPWVVLGYHDDARLQLQAAQNTIQARFPVTPAPLSARYHHARLRLGYISSDYNRHPVAAQLAHLVELHDRTRFEVIGLSTGRDDGSPERARLAAGFDRFIDLRGTGTLAAAQAIRDLEIDLLIDLNGHTSGDNFEILSHRPAPVQAAWLGHAGTSAAPFIDHIIADSVVAPNAGDFTEQRGMLPHCFFPTDAMLAIGAAPTRAAAGLPRNAFVFACFNNNWKITAPVFALWMRLLRQVEGSVLWLRRPNDAAAMNLAHTAREAGIDPARLVFAAPVALEVHLARHVLADLFLDTLPYNAHATCCDALWAGLPVVTCAGSAYAGRVAASMLTAVGLPELITQSPQDYEDLALALARDPVRLGTLRARLASRAATPLFDMTQFARDIEALYLRLMQ